MTAGTDSHGNGYAADTKSSEQQVVDLVREELGVHVEPQALRMFVRHRWDRLHVLMHRIHEGKR